MKKSALVLLSAVATTSLFAALDPKEEVRAAVARLAEKPNYAWVTTTKNNAPPPQNQNAEEPQGRARFVQSQQNPIEAKTVRGGITQLTSRGGDDTIVQVATKGDKAIMKTKEGWKPLEDFRGGFRPPPGDQAQAPGQAFGGQRGQRGQAPGTASQGGLANNDGGQVDQAGDRGQRGRRARPEGGGPQPGGPGSDVAGGQRGGFGGGPGGFGPFDPSTFMARRLQRAKLPTVEVLDMLDQVQNLKAAGVGYYVGDLPQSGVFDMMTGRRGGGARGGGREGQDNPNFRQPRFEGTKATAKFWTTGGVLTRYEMSVSTKVTMPFGDAAERTVDFTNTTEIRQIGTSRLDLPKEAFAMLLGPTQPAPAPAARPAAPRPSAPAPTAQGAPEQN
jgi:hypothetical protein